MRQPGHAPVQALFNRFFYRRLPQVLQHREPKDAWKMHDLQRLRKGLNRLSGGGEVAALWKSLARGLSQRLDSANLHSELGPTGY